MADAMNDDAQPRAPCPPDLKTLHVAAEQLVDAVHALDRVGVAAALTRARRDWTGPGDPIEALAVLLAGAVAEDAPIVEQVVWVHDPERYARARAHGLSPSMACAQIADHLHRHRHTGGHCP